MSDFIARNDLRVDPVLVDFIEKAALPGTGVSADAFWAGFDALVHGKGPKNRALLEKRAEIQAQIDAWHVANRGKDHDAATYQAFLKEIGYLVPEGADFAIETTDVDPEIAMIPGAQLVVPIMNARFALNAANARWGSLYDALYGTDALGSLPSGGGYDAARGAQVISWGRAHLDAVVPLADGSWADIAGLKVSDGALSPALQDPSQFVGHNDGPNGLAEVFLKVNGLLIDIVIDASSAIGSADKAGISDIILESAMSTIMDCEDSVAAVDGEDKVLAYTNWLGLMKGDLAEDVTKGGKTFQRVLNEDVGFTGADGARVTHKGRSLMLIRNVGHLMTNPAVIDKDGQEVGEGLMDAMVTTLIAMHDLQRESGNSVTGSVYVVKPKMHGPEEVAFADEIFTHVVLDRTGDEIHTSMEAGPMIPKGEMKACAWIASYEDRNVDIGLACGLQGKAQIGKGMWAMPDRMAEMLEAKVGHPLSGANCAWVPSPTAATLHATHYHKIDVLAKQAEIKAGGARGTLDDLLTIPVARGANWSDEEITREIENNAQGILGYVVRWGR